MDTVPTKAITPNGAASVNEPQATPADQLDAALGEVVEFAIAIGGADFGNVQLIDSVTGDLRIHAHRGLPEWWIDYWNSAGMGHGCCHATLKRGACLIVEDVESSSIFVGTPALEVQRKAGIRGVQSTPIVSRAGIPLGVFSTHYKAPCCPDQRTLVLFDMLASQAADLIERHRAEQALRVSEAKYRAMVESAREGVTISSTDGLMTFVNKRMADLLGYEVDEMLGRPALDFTFPDGEPRVHEANVDVGESGALEGDFKLRRKDGSPLWTHFTGVCLFDEQGQHVANMARHTDITEHKRAEVAERQRQERQAFLLSLSDAVRPLTDPVEIIARTSELAGRWLGVGRCGYAEVDGDHLIVPPDWTDGVMPSLQGEYRLEQFGDFIAECRAGRTVVIEDAYDDSRARKVEALFREIGGLRANLSVPLLKNGAWVASIYAHQSTARHWTASEIALIEEVADRTWAAVERARAELELRESEAKFRAVFETMIEACCIFDMIYDDLGKPVDWRILEANPGYERASGLKDVAGKLASEFMPGTEPYWIETFARVAKTGEAEQIEKWHEPTGRWVHSSTARVGDSGSRRLASVFYDITERKRAEIALREAIQEADTANTAKSRFLAAASHDLRQPLSALNIYVSSLKGHVDPDGEFMLSNLKACIASLSELLSDLLDLSKLDAGVVNINREAFLLEHLIEPLISAHAPEAMAKGLQFRSRLVARAVHTDPVLLRRIVGNLIVNAIKYTQRGGVLVGYRRHAGKDWLEVWDTGVGIPADKTSEIFEEFKQLGSDARTRGSGLGLAIVDRAAKLLQLEIRVRSRLGKGSLFAIELPVGEAPHLAAPVLPLYTPQLLRVALIEDNEALREALVIGLRNAGHRVWAASSGAAVLAMLAGEGPDIVVSDYRLESETGFQVIATLRGIFGPDLPALVITGDTDPALVRSMADHGIVVLHKPVDLETLVAYMEDATASS